MTEEKLLMLMIKAIQIYRASDPSFSLEEKDAVEEYARALIGERNIVVTSYETQEEGRYRLRLQSAHGEKAYL